MRQGSKRERIHALEGQTDGHPSVGSPGAWRAGTTWKFRQQRKGRQVGDGPLLREVALRIAEQVEGKVVSRPMRDDAQVVLPLLTKLPHPLKRRRAQVEVEQEAKQGSRIPLEQARPGVTLDKFARIGDVEGLALQVQGLLSLLQHETLGRGAQRIAEEVVPFLCRQKDVHGPVAAFDLARVVIEQYRALVERSLDAGGRQ